MMTTLTTVLGLLPMAIGLGEGSNTIAPIAIVVVGGLFAIHCPYSIIYTCSIHSF